MTLGEKIVHYRNLRGLTQKGLADLMEISPTRLNYWEKDKREPDVKMLNLLCKTLRIDPGYLLSDDEEKSPAPPEGSAGENGKLSMDEVEKVLLSLGLIQEGQDVTEDDLRFINSVLDLIDMWFQNRHQKG